MRNIAYYLVYKSTLDEQKYFRIKLVRDLELTKDDLPGLDPFKTDRIVAKVTSNPQDCDIFGLTNCSSNTWIATLATKEQMYIETGKTIRIEINTMINFGIINGVIASLEGKDDPKEEEQLYDKQSSNPNMNGLGENCPRCGVHSDSIKCWCLCYA
jgi:hypothetical protein